MKWRHSPRISWKQRSAHSFAGCRVLLLTVARGLHKEADFPSGFLLGTSSLAGPQECWLLTANRLQVVTAQVKMCLNPHCLALHSFTDIYTGRCQPSMSSSTPDQVWEPPYWSVLGSSIHCTHLSSFWRIGLCPDCLCSSNSRGWEVEQ
jgi:hypothetical protein